MVGKEGRQVVGGWQVMKCSEKVVWHGMVAGPSNNNVNLSLPKVETGREGRREANEIGRMRKKRTSHLPSIYMYAQKAQKCMC